MESPLNPTVALDERVREFLALLDAEPLTPTPPVELS